MAPVASVTLPAEGAAKHVAAAAEERRSVASGVVEVPAAADRAPPGGVPLAAAAVALEVMVSEGPADAAAAVSPAGAGSDGADGAAQGAGGPAAAAAQSAPADAAVRPPAAGDATAAGGADDATGHAAGDAAEREPQAGVEEDGGASKTDEANSKPAGAMLKYSSSTATILANKDKSSLQLNMARVAMLLPDDFDKELIQNMCLIVKLQAKLTWDGTPCQLMIVNLDEAKDYDPETADKDLQAQYAESPPAVQLDKLRDICRDIQEAAGSAGSHRRSRAGTDTSRQSSTAAGEATPPSPKNESTRQSYLESRGRCSVMMKPFVPIVEDFVWPLHNQTVVKELVLSYQNEFTNEDSSWRRRLEVILQALRLKTMARGDWAQQEIEHRYGEGASFSMLWGTYYAQMLWIIALLYPLWVVIGEPPPTGSKGDSTKRGLWHMCKALCVVWGLFLAILGWKRYAVQQEDQSGGRAKWRVTRNPYVSLDNENRRCAKCRSWLKLLLFGVPAFAFFILLVVVTVGLFTALTLHVIYIWGGCINEGPECRSPQDKWGFVGWLVEVAIDVSLAIIFELFFAVEDMMAEHLVRLRQYEYKSDHLFASKTIKAAMASVERMGFISCLAFAFVPQWMEPASDTKIDWAVGCSQYFMGESSLQCLQKRLPLQQRRWVFEKLMKGPFMVAPFVQILMKIVVPLVAQLLDFGCHRGPGRGLWIFAPFRCIARILGLIFAYDGGHTGGVAYIWRGRPEPRDDANIEIMGEINDDDGETAIHEVREAISQFKRKPYEPESELADLQMSFIWVVFCMPIRPFGVLPTLVAKLLESHFRLYKLLFIRRRAFPESSKVYRQTQSSFTFAAVSAATAWMFGLSLISYNDELWKWGRWGQGTLAAIFAWMAVSAFTPFWYNGIGATSADENAMANMTTAFTTAFQPTASAKPGKDSE